MSPERKFSMDEPYCQTDKIISVQIAESGLPIQLFFNSVPKMALKRELNMPSPEKTCRQTIAIATLPPIIEGK